MIANLSKKDFRITWHRQELIRSLKYPTQSMRFSSCLGLSVIHAGHNCELAKVQFVFFLFFAGSLISFLSSICSDSLLKIFKLTSTQQKAKVEACHECKVQLSRACSKLQLCTEEMKERKAVAKPSEFSQNFVLTTRLFGIIISISASGMRNHGRLLCGRWNEQSVTRSVRKERVPFKMCLFSVKILLTTMMNRRRWESFYLER